MTNDPHILLSVPPGMASCFGDCETRLAASCFAASDPPQRPLGSGGGTTHLLVAGWKAAGSPGTFADWLRGRRIIAAHGGGQSRRLPAYAAAGKLFIPVPAYRWAYGQRLDQTLIDLQLEFLRNVYRRAHPQSRVLVASGDVLIHSEANLPALPDADVVLLGLWVRPEEAQHFGVMFCDPADPTRLVRFLQKPTPDTIRSMAAETVFMIDIGVWLLSERAVRVLMQRSGWDPDAGRYEHGEVRPCDLYGHWALNLGTDPVEEDLEISGLTCAAVPLADSLFYHFGRSRDMIESVYSLQNLVVDQTRLGRLGGQPHPKQFIQNSRFECPLRQEENHTLWVENSAITKGWTLASEHVLTGVPDNDWDLKLPAGTCMDFVPLGDERYGVRLYGMDDEFRGDGSEPGTAWFGRPAAAWFAARGISMEAAGALGDIQRAPLFPVLERDEIDSAFLQWLIDEHPADDEGQAARWIAARRLSAMDLTCRADLRSLYRRRSERRAEALPRMARNWRRSILYKLDLDSTAGMIASTGAPLPDEPPDLPESDPLLAVRERMFRSAVLRKRGDAGAGEAERRAFELLRRSVVDRVCEMPAMPGRTLLEDQIVWGRSPVRLDMAGGWTDTPPYCFTFGGQVMNLAVDLNGQPPVQVFAKVSEQPEIVIRSIDLGLEERVTTYEELCDTSRTGSGFAVARAAAALAGFHPRFSGGPHGTLREQLESLGGGLELSMLAAVPKGSGLGTSSVLASTLLGVLSDLAGLDWDVFEIMRRTTALEQMLGSGGGWQDQAGSLLPGAKLIETDPGFEQRPTVRWLPSRFFDAAEMGGRSLLYYTGITRVAHSILGEIVRGIFLNARERLEVIDRIGKNALVAYEAAQQQDAEAFAEAIRRSWELNCLLDAGTNVPGVQAILDVCGDDLKAAKLLGAGGGGYLYMIANDADAARGIRERLRRAPPNSRARFVDFTLSETGLQVTRS
jgi:galactokinase/mevalonate kinase-like predicted kinase